MSSSFSQCQLVSLPAKLKNSSRVYACQCGKNYVNFASLYLHFQKKHQMAISTKKTATNRIVVQINGKVQETYYYSKDFVEDYSHEKEENKQWNKQKNINEQAEKFQQLNLLSKILTSFVFQCSTKQHLLWKKQTILQIMEQLQNYLENEKKKKFNSIFQATKGFKISQLPYFFNPYIHFKAASLACNLTDESISKICDILMNLALWMKKNGHTKLVVEYDLKV